MIRYVNFPVILSGTGLIPPASAVNYVPWAIVGFVFQYVVRRRHFSWWTKYNYVLSAALDSGVAVGAILVFFWYVPLYSQSFMSVPDRYLFHSLQYPQNGAIGAETLTLWWGNTVFLNTADARGDPMRVVADGETFGPTKW